MEFNKENIKAFCKDALVWTTANVKGLIMLGLGLFLLFYTYRVFLYIILFALGSMLSYAGLRELKFESCTNFFDNIMTKIRSLWCGPR